MFEYTANQLSVDETQFEEGSEMLNLAHLLVKALPILQEKQPEIRFLAPKNGKIDANYINVSINGEEVGRIIVRYVNRAIPYEMYYANGPFVKPTKNRYDREVCRRKPEDLFDLCVEGKFFRLKSTKETYIEAMNDFIWNYISCQLQKDEREASDFIYLTYNKEDMLRFVVTLKLSRPIMNYLANLPKLAKKINKLEMEVAEESEKLAAELNVEAQVFSIFKHSPNLKKIMTLYTESLS